MTEEAYGAVVASLGSGIGVPESSLRNTRYLHRGRKVYEFSNHLGNVLVTLSDFVSGTDTDNDGIANTYEAIVISATDYYPFGSAMPQRSENPGAYRYGFNGKENDRDWGTGLIQDYGFRLYNPAIAKFLSVDPLAPEYPELTCYQFASNTPIWAIDLDGLEAIASTDYKTLVPTLTIQRIDYKDGLKLVRVWGTSNGKSTYTDLWNNGVSEGDLQSAGGCISFLFYPEGRCNAVRRFLQLGTGIANNRNTMGILAWRMLENSKSQSGSKDAKEASNNKYHNCIIHFGASTILALKDGYQDAKFAMDAHELGRPGKEPKKDVDRFFEKEADNLNDFQFYNDKYQDLLNNEWGREFAKNLTTKYPTINFYKTAWSVETTVLVLNEIQDYLGKTFGIVFEEKFDKDNKYVKKFTQVINQEEACD